MATFGTSLKPVFLEAKLKAGIWSGDVQPAYYFDPVNFLKLELTPIKQDRIRSMSNMLGSIGEALDTQFKPTEPAGFTGEIDNFNQELGSIILGADVSTESQTGATVADELVTTLLNKWVPLVNKNIATTGFSVTTGADVAVDSSKYEVDVYSGLIKAIHTDAVGVGMKVSYTTETVARTIFSAGKAKVTALQIIGHALDKTSNQYGLLRIHKAIVASNQAIDIVASGYLKGTLEGDLITPAGYSSPWEFVPYV